MQTEIMNNMASDCIRKEESKLTRKGLSMVYACIAVKL